MESLSFRWSGRIKSMKISDDFKLNVVSVRLVKEAPILSDIKISNPEAAVQVLGKYLCEMDREVLCVVNLKSDNTPINCTMASMGSLNQSIVSPREIFKASILSNAAHMLLIHNHPSGSLNPSKEDIEITDRLIKLTDLMEIPLLDHIIVGGDEAQYFSMREKGIMLHERTVFEQDYNNLKFNDSAMVAEKEKSR